MRENYSDIFTNEREEIVFSMADDFFIKEGKGGLQPIKVVKNNDSYYIGAVLTGDSGNKITAVINVSEVVGREKDNEKAAEEIILMVTKQMNTKSAIDGIDLTEVMDLDKISGRIKIMVLNKEMNQSIIDSCITVAYLDLLVVPYISFEGKNEAIIKITKELASMYGATASELVSIGVNNMRGKYRINTVDSMLFCEEGDTGLSGLSDEEIVIAKDSFIPLFALSTTDSRYGASYLYDSLDGVRHFADITEMNVIIIPSSIYEILLYPVPRDIDSYDLNDTAISILEMIKDINQDSSLIKKEEILSNHPYIYRVDSGLTTILQ